MQLPQLYTHSKSVDFQGKSLLSHVWAGQQVRTLILQAGTSSDFLTLVYHYIIKNTNGYMYIIDYKDHFITDYKEYYNLGINSIRFEFVNTDYRKFN